MRPKDVVGHMSLVSSKAGTRTQTANLRCIWLLFNFSKVHT